MHFSFVFVLFLFFFVCVCVTCILKHTQLKFKMSVFPLGSQSQIPLIEYSKTTNKLLLLLVPSAKNYKIQFETYPAIAVERAEWKKVNKD